MIAIKLEPAAPAAQQRPPVVEAPATGGEAIRYLVASLAALSLDATLLWAGVEHLRLPAWIAGTFGYGCGLVLVYGLSIRWVFARRALRSARAEFVLFAALGLVGLLLNAVTLFVATGVGLALPVAKGLSAAIGFVANFITRKVLLFSVAS